MTSTDLVNTGERQHTEQFDVNALEHLHRYAFAAGICSNRDVLDIASGEGYGSNLLAKTSKTVIGVDISAGAISHSKQKYKRSNLDFLAGSGDAIPLEDNSVDCVVSFETLEHHDKHEEMLSEIQRVLRPGGILVMSTPDKENYTDKPNQINPYHVKELYFDEFKDLICRHFNNVEIYLQRAGYYDIISPTRKHLQPFYYYKGDFTEYHRLSNINEAHYNICVASDAELPPTSLSAYEGHKVYSALLALSHQRKNEIANLQRGLASANKQLADIRSSITFRIGSIFTYPHRVFKALLQ